ncbi:MAG: hypothetical protein KDA92_25660, partial [Planctomycetales bacterium]|nr:hypothetical protein [Planctomycetales bacterium]
QLAFNNTQRENLDFDQEGLQREIAALTQYRGLLDSKFNELKTELSRLYRTNKQMVGMPVR